MAGPIRCTTLREFLAADGRHILAVGKYRARAITQGKKAPDEEPDHAGVELSDGHQVLLEPNWSDDAIRDPEERARFDSHDVEVEGVARAKSPQPPEPVAYLIGPCISPVRSIRLAP